MKCQKCNNEMVINAKFCPECGSKVERQGKTCPNEECSKLGLPTNAIFCPDCGTKLSDDNEAKGDNHNDLILYLSILIGIVVVILIVAGINGSNTPNIDPTAVDSVSVLVEPVDTVAPDSVVPVADTNAVGDITPYSTPDSVDIPY